MKKKGFTLIELIIVVIIIGVLAAIAVPMMSGIRIKAMCSEAIAAMGTLRNACRMYVVEGKEFGSNQTRTLGVDESLETDLGIKASDFDGKYFSSGDYRVETQGAGTASQYWIYAYPNIGPGGAFEGVTDGADAYIWMEPDGIIRQYNFSRSGYPD